METENDPLSEFIRRTIEEARVQAIARNNPGIPAGMMPAVSIGGNEPLSNTELKFVMDAFVLKCADDVRREGFSRMPGMPAGMAPAVDLGPPPVPEKVSAVKLKSFVQKAGELGVTFPPEMMPPTGPETVLPVVKREQPEQGTGATVQEPEAKVERPRAAPTEAAPQKIDGPEIVSANPDKITMRNVLNPALIAAAKSGQTEEVRKQIRKGADVNGGDAAKETALHAAAKGNHAEALRVLLLNRGDPFQKSADGQSAMDIVQQRKNPAVMAVLEDPKVRKMIDTTVGMTYSRANRPQFTP